MERLKEWGEYTPYVSAEREMSWNEANNRKDLIEPAFISNCATSGI
jgi:hypothetical protein